MDEQIVTDLGLNFIEKKSSFANAVKRGRDDR